MSPRLTVHFLEVGHCRHCERVALRGGSFRVIRFPAMCALILHPTRGALLYDTGYAPRFIEATQTYPERLYRWLTPMHLANEERLEAQLARQGLRPSDIHACLISHFHADHIAGLRDLPKAQFYALERDVEGMKARSRLGGLRRGLLPALLPPDFATRIHLANRFPGMAGPGPWACFGEVFDVFGDGSLLAIALPGHTEGHMGLALRDQHDREVFLCADACWSRAAWQELRYPSLLARPIMSDWNAYRATLQKIHQLGRQHPEITILPSHCRASLNDYRQAARAAPVL